MKKYIIYLPLFLLVACSDGNYKQVGYFKQNDERVFTYNTKETDPMLIRQHGAKRYHTEGHTTISLYFHKDAPDITKSYNRASAYDEAKIAHPFAEVFVLPNGKDSMMVYHN